MSTNRKLPPSVIDVHGGLTSWVAGFFFWFIQRPHFQNGLITQVLAHSHKKGCPLYLFNVPDTTRVVVVLLMGWEGADDFEGGIANVDMASGSAKKDVIRAR